MIYGMKSKQNGIVRPYQQNMKLKCNDPGRELVEPLHFSHHYTVSLVQWVNGLLPTKGGSRVRILGMHPHFC
jgi:hypothetical protein